MEAEMDEQRYPDFIISVNKSDGLKIYMKLPIKFINEYGQQLPSNLTLEAPNGTRHKVTFDNNKKAISDVRSIFKIYQILSEATILFWYEGYGKFKIFIMKDNGSEMKYPITKKSLSSRLYRQDEIYGAGWRFVVKATPSTLESGEIVIPTSFLQQFGDFIPNKITFSLTNDEKFEGSYYHFDGTLKGLTILRDLSYIQLSDTLLFTYCTNGIFEIGIFDNSSVEKLFTEYLIDNHLKNENHPKLDCNGNKSFSAVMLWSHVDKNSHGVHIPQLIKPQNREWIRGENVIFTNNKNAWSIGIVFSNGKARFSKGWNKFVREIGLQINHTLTLKMLEEEENIIF